MIVEDLAGIFLKAYEVFRTVGRYWQNMGSQVIYQNCFNWIDYIAKKLPIIEWYASSVGIEMWFNFRRDKRFSLLHGVQTGSGAHQTSHTAGTGVRAWSWPLTFIYCGGQERCSYTSTTPYVFMTRWLIKHRGNCTFTSLTYIQPNIRICNARIQTILKLLLIAVTQIQYLKSAVTTEL